MTLGKFCSSLCQVFVHISVLLGLCLHSFCLRACFSKLDKVFIMWLAKYVPNGDLTRGATETGGTLGSPVVQQRVGQVTTRQPWPPLGSCGWAGLGFAFPAGWAGLGWVPMPGFSYGSAMWLVLAVGWERWEMFICAQWGAGGGRAWACQCPRGRCLVILPSGFVLYLAALQVRFRLLGQHLFLI